MNFRKVIVNAAVFVGLVTSVPAFSAPQSPVEYRVIPFSDYYESAGLPPDLWVHFDVKCNQTFIKLIREDIVTPDSLKVTIVIGGLVSENLALPCSSSTETSVFGGSTFSGREFEVKAIK